MAWAKTLLLILIALGSFARAEIPGVGGSDAMGQRLAKWRRNCPIFAEPSLDSKIVCKKKEGTKLPVFSKRLPSSDGKARYYRVISPKCRGFVPMKCIRLSKAAVNPGLLKRVADEQTARDRYIPPTKLSLSANFDAVTAAVSYSSEASRGLGYSALVRLVHPLNRVMRGSIGGGYQFYRLARDFSFNGATAVGGSDTIRQQVGYASALLYMGFRMVDGGARRRPSGLSRINTRTDRRQEGGDTDYSPRETTWWLEGGFEGLFPLHASQSGGVTVSDANVTDKALLAVGGITAEFPRSGTLGFGAYGQIVFNLAGTNGSRFYGIRLGVAIEASL